MMVVDWFVRVSSFANGFGCGSSGGCNCVLAAPTQSREQSSVAAIGRAISAANHDDYWPIALER